MQTTTCFFRKYLLLRAPGGREGLENACALSFVTFTASKKKC